MGIAVPITVGTTNIELQKGPSGLYISPVVRSFLIGAFGLLLCVIATGKALLNHSYSTEGRQTVATVTWSGYTHTKYADDQAIRYAFTLPDGRTFKGSQTGYSGTRGGSILVSYLPSHPSFNRVAGAERQEQRWLPFVALVGAFLVLIGVRSRVYQKRKMQGGEEFSSSR